VEATAAITMVLAMMDTVVELVAMATAHHRLLAVSRTSHPHLPLKLQHTLAETVAVVYPHLLLQVGCLVWLLLPLNITKVATAEATTTTMVAVATTMGEVTEEAATTAAEITMAEDIAAEEEEEVAVAEVVMTDIRRILLALRSGGTNSSNVKARDYMHQY